MSFGQQIEKGTNFFTWSKEWPNDIGGMNTNKSCGPRRQPSISCLLSALFDQWNSRSKICFFCSCFAEQPREKAKGIMALIMCEYV